MNIVNLTPHAVKVLDPVSGAVSLELAKPDAGTRIPRVAVARVEIPGAHPAVKIFKTSFGKVEDLPPEAPGTLLLVSALVREAGRALGRSDLCSPGELVRDAAGQPLGCRGLDT